MIQVVLNFFQRFSDGLLQRQREQKLFSHPLFVLAKKITQSVYFRIGASAFFLFIAFRTADLNLVVQQLRQVPIGVVAMLLVGHALFHVLSAVRWSILLVPQDQKISQSIFLKTIAATFLGNFYSLFLPTVIGGDVIKWTSLLDAGLSKKRLLVSVFVDRFVGLSSMILIGVCSVAFAYFFSIVTLPIQIVWLSGALSMCFAIAVAWVFGLVAVGRFIPFPQFRQFESYVQEHKMVLVKATAVSIIVQLFSFWMNWIGAIGLGLSISLLYICMISPLIALILVLPVSFSGLGAIEASYIFFYTQVGLVAEQILAWTSLNLVIKFLFAIIGWGLAQVLQYWGKEVQK